MGIEKGSIVRSKRGHDQNRWFVVLACRNGFAYIADGKERRLERPKRKNIKHLAATAAVVDVGSLDTDKKIRNVLWPYNYGGETPVTQPNGGIIRG